MKERNTLTKDEFKKLEELVGFGNHRMLARHLGVSERSIHHWRSGERKVDVDGPIHRLMLLLFRDGPKLWRRTKYANGRG